MHKSATQRKPNRIPDAGNHKQKTTNYKQTSMPVILPVENKYPEFGNNCFIAPNATIVGDVVMGDDCSIWFNAVLRGDVNFIKMGNKVNVQDGACIHCTYLKCGTPIGNNVSIGHNAISKLCRTSRTGREPTTSLDASFRAYVSIP